MSCKQLRCLMIIKAVHVVGNYIHFHAAFSLLCLLPTKEIISGGVAAAGEEARRKTWHIALLVWKLQHANDEQFD